MYKICHTEDSSRRQRELEQGFLEMLRSQPYDKITLTELCRQLNVPRKSFYRYSSSALFWKNRIFISLILCFK